MMEKTNNRIPLTLLFLLFLNIAICKAEVVVKGHISGGQGTEIELAIPIAINLAVKTSYLKEIDDAGNFKFNIKIDESRWAYLQYGDHRSRLFLTDGEEIIIFFQEDDLSQPFKVSQTSPNNFVYQQLQKIRPDYEITRKWRKMLYPDSAYEEMIYFRTKEEQALDSLDNIYKITPEYYDILKLDIEYRYPSLFYYASITNRLASKHAAAKARWNKLVHELFDNLKTDNPEAFQVLSYRWLMRTNYDYFIFGIKNTSKTQFYGLSEEELNKLQNGNQYNYCQYFFFTKLFSGDVEELLCADRILTSLEEGYFPNLILIYTDFKKRFPGSRYLPYMEEKMELVQTIKKGKPVEGITFYTKEKHETINNWESLITPFRGKVTVIDLWGTWCGPCRGQFSYVNALKERFKDKPVQYLYIAWEQDNYPEDRWKEMVKFFKLKGVHHIANEALFKEIEDLFGKNGSFGFPTYIILNKEGEAVVTNAYRPSEGEKLYAQIEAVLQGQVPAPAGRSATR